jgi:hypothetical protein
MESHSLKDFIGHIFTDVAFQKSEEDRSELVFTRTDGALIRMHHLQDCCESVEIADITGDLKDLIGIPIIVAEERISTDDPPEENYYENSYTWTFYVFRTTRGDVTIRWFGGSNGYYSERVEVEIETGLPYYGKTVTREIVSSGA